MSAEPRHASCQSQSTHRTTHNTAVLTATCGGARYKFRRGFSSCLFANEFSSHRRRHEKPRQHRSDLDNVITRASSEVVFTFESTAERLHRRCAERDLAVVPRRIAEGGSASNECRVSWQARHQFRSAGAPSEPSAVRRSQSPLAVVLFRRERPSIEQQSKWCQTRPNTATHGARASCAPPRFRGVVRRSVRWCYAG